MRTFYTEEQLLGLVLLVIKMELDKELEISGSSPNVFKQFVVEFNIKV